MNLDHLCLECPLSTCSEDSLWCVRRLVTNPNPAQLALFTAPDTKKERDRVIRIRDEQRAYYRTHREERRAYQAEYYRRNRDKKLAAAKERAARLRDQRQ